MKKLISILLIIFALAMPVMAQDYKVEYETLLTDYETLLDDYEDLIEEYDFLKGTYEGEIYEHELSKDQIVSDQREIGMLRDDVEDLLYYINPKYFTVFLIGGYFEDKLLGEIALSADIPQVPFSVYAGVEYIYTIGVNFKLGVGVNF